MIRNLSFAKAINEAIDHTMKKDNKIILMGLGVDDPKGIFGTTLGLHKKYKNNVFDMPTSENGFTGIGLGLAISGFKPIIVHQRVEFSLLTLEQIFNQISKWFYMSGGKVNVPMVIRLIIGKGWGQGPQHSQSLEAIFAHIPGLKVVCPSNAYDAKGLLQSSIKDPDPVIFFEHRWLHHTISSVPKKNYSIKIGKSKIIKSGNDITLISFSLGVYECLKAIEYLKNQNKNINIELIDLRSLTPIDRKAILKSAKKTKKVLIIDNGLIKNGISAEISAIINEYLKEKIKTKRVGILDTPIPSSISIAKYCYTNYKDIVIEILKMLSKDYKNLKFGKELNKSDQPDRNFIGPF